MFSKTAARSSRAFIILVSIMFAAAPVFAMNGRTTYQAKISKPNGYPLESANVNFRFTVLDTVGACILYVEDYAAINMQDTGGLVSFALGNGSRSFPTSGTSMTFQHIFDNSVTSFPCQNAGVYLPGPTDTRKIVMQFNEGAGWQTLPAMAINSVPYSMFANEANNTKTLNGKADTAFVENSTLAALNCQPNEALRFNGASFSCVNISVSATAVVAALGYTPVQSVSATAPLSSTGGSTPTLSISQATSSTNGYLSSTDWSTFNNKVNPTSAAIIAALGYTPADNVAVSGTFLVKASNLSDLANVATARTNLGLGSFATASSLDLGSASATGTIADARLANQSAITSGTQYTKVTVDGKGRVTNGSNLSSSDVTTALGFTPADNAASGTYLTKASNLSDLSNVATARTNLGLGSLAVASSLDLGSASATGTIADARLANQSAITSGTQYTKVTVDGKGRVTNGANLASSDVTTALGYTPAQASSATQWTTNGTSISYNSGKVGIGTSSPSSLLEVKQTSATVKVTSTDGTSAANFVSNINGLFKGYFGTEGIGGTTFTNSLTYATIVGSESAVPLHLGTNAAVQATLLTNGNFGLGTTAPGNKFTVQADANTSGAPQNSQFQIQGNMSSSKRLNIAFNTSSNYGELSAETSAGVYAPINLNPNGGNVGIGTVNPTSLLYLKSNSSGMNGIISLEADGGGVTNLYSARSALSHANKGVLENSNGILINPAGGNVGIGVTSASGVLQINTPDATPNILLSRSATNTNWAIRNSNNGVSDTLIIADNANNNRGIAVEASGNVGIGTTAPVAKLDVAGQVKTSMGTPLVNPAGNAVDFTTGNTQYVTFSSCPGNALTINLYSMFEGSSYSIVVVAPNGCVVDFTGTTRSSSGSGGTAVTAFKYPAGQKFSSTGNPMVYSFLRANNFVFVAQVVDFQ